MRRSLSLVSTLGALLLAAAACGPKTRVRTQASPEASFTSLRTFRVLAAPRRAPGAPTLPASDPMLQNSITNAALRNDLQRAFESRGYSPASGRPDFVVAYYASTRELADTTYVGPWDYGYRFGAWRRAYWFGAPWYGDPRAYDRQIQARTQGTVLVDVIEPRTRQLIWRGQGVATVSDDPEIYTKQLRSAVDAIVSKFPAQSEVSQGR